MTIIYSKPKKSKFEEPKRTEVMGFDIGNEEWGKTIGIPFSEYKELIKTLGEINVSQFDEVINQIIKQSGYWKIQWVFSASHSPNFPAKNELELYEAMFKTFISVQEKSAPGTMAIYIKTKQLVEIKFITEWNIEYLKDKPIKKIGNNILGLLSQALKKIGLKEAASELLIRQLFPDWTVGRNGPTNSNN